MKAYKFGDNKLFQDIVIEEDDGIIKVVFASKDKVVEYIAKPINLPSGTIRLMFGTGSSMPYKNEKGEICDKFTLIYEK